MTIPFRSRQASQADSLIGTMSQPDSLEMENRPFWQSITETGLQILD
ncbi:MAG: hypothetical protein RKP73_09890 [Candidatus Contendobacter sp.]|nr:hypothetical protein [Candidatus Contendobacter sp.]